MNSQLEAARHSSILNAAESKANDSLEYTAKKSLEFPGILSRQTITLNCDNEFKNCVAQGITGQIDLPKYGFLSSIVLEIENTSTDHRDQFFPLRYFSNLRSDRFAGGGTFGNVYELFEEFTLKTKSGKELTTIKGHTCQDLLSLDGRYAAERALTDTESFSVSGGSYGNWLSSDVIGDGFDSGVLEKKLFCPIPFRMFDKFCTCPDLLSLEQIQLHIRGSRKERVSSYAGFMKDLTLRIHLTYHLPTPEKHESILKALHPSGGAWNHMSTTYKNEPIKKMTMGGVNPKAITGGYALFNTAKTPLYYGFAAGKSNFIRTSDAQFQVTQQLDPLEIDITVAQPVKRTFLHCVHEPTGRRGIITGYEVTDAGNVLFSVHGRKLLDFHSRNSSLFLNTHGSYTYKDSIRHTHDTELGALDNDLEKDSMGAACIEWGMTHLFKDEPKSGGAVSFHQMSAPRIKVFCALPPIRKNLMQWDDTAAGLKSADEATNLQSLSHNYAYNKTQPERIDTVNDKIKYVYTVAEVAANPNATPPTAKVPAYLAWKDMVASDANDKDDNVVQDGETLYYYEGKDLEMKLVVTHEVYEVTTVQPTASNRNRQIRVVGTR